ncbi:hypothetical protein L873DRAFT_1831427 [Choiromyces venosus 120613-1]|uniref:Uncharacterized protein n=1 Tax=Choiromyces venosus 120613-1 TaxID=1336337 RepID=A0A3N4IZC3_9PEZI|nr:hypothetical protein L873DRAFT_1831427 [Choiromyces venosus 120613-1]
MGEFEDNYEDEYKEVEEVLEAGDEDDEEGGRRDSMEIDQQVYMPSWRVLGKAEILEPDPTAYHLLHSMIFDRRGYPHRRRTRSSNLAPSNPTTTNRIRASPHAHHAASMAETGDMYIWELSLHYRAFESPGTAIPASANKPTATLRMDRHSSNPQDVMGRIATGDNSGKIFIFTRKEGGTWATDGSLLKGRMGIKIYDARAQTKNHQLSVDVSSSDVNVASWCRAVPHLLASGADDGVWGVWDLRAFPNTLKGEHQPITSVEFRPTEDSIVSVASADSTITLWDLRVELDNDESKDTGGMEDIPPQLLFVHYHKDVKEVHWQKQAFGVVIGTGVHKTNK